MTNWTGCSINTDQTITGDKRFEGDVTFAGGLTFEDQAAAQLAADIPRSAGVMAGVDSSGAATAYAFADDYMRAPWLARSDTSSRTSPFATKAYSLNFDFDVAMVEETGQSLADGTKARPAFSTAGSWLLDMLSGGVRIYPNRATLSSQTLTSFAEADGVSIDGSTQTGETPTGGLAQGLIDLARMQYGQDPTALAWRVFGLCTAIGGIALSDLLQPGSSNPNTSFQAGTTAVQRATSLYAAQTPPRRCAVLGGGLMHGPHGYTNNVAEATYLSQLLTLRSQKDAAYKAITGQTRDYKLVITQTASHSACGKSTPTMARAQRDATDQDEHCIMAGPDYWCRGADDLHILSQPTKMAGLMQARALFYTVVTGQQFKPLSFVEKFRSGRAILARMNRPWGSNPIRVNTADVRPVTNYGLGLYNRAASADIALDDVSLVPGTDLVRFLATNESDLPASLTDCAVRSGWLPGPTVNSGPYTGPRTNICAPTDIILMAGEVSHRLVDWLIIDDF